MGLLNNRNAAGASAVIVILALLFVVGCETETEVAIEEAQALIEQGQYTTAFERLENAPLPEDRESSAYEDAVDEIREMKRDLLPKVTEERIDKSRQLRDGGDTQAAFDLLEDFQPDPPLESSEREAVDEEISKLRSELLLQQATDRFESNRYDSAVEILDEVRELGHKLDAADELASKIDTARERRSRAEQKAEEEDWEQVNAILREIFEEDGDWEFIFEKFAEGWECSDVAEAIVEDDSLSTTILRAIHNDLERREDDFDDSWSRRRTHEELTKRAHIQYKLSQNEIAWDVSVSDVNNFGEDYAEISGMSVSDNQIAFTLRNTQSGGILAQICFEVRPKWEVPDARDGSFFPQSHTIPNGESRRISFDFQTGDSLPDNTEFIEVSVRQFIDC